MVRYQLSAQRWGRPTPSPTVRSHRSCTRSA